MEGERYGKTPARHERACPPNPTIRPGSHRNCCFAPANMAQWVEEAAAVNARAIVTATSYLSPLTSTSDRHQYCVEHLNRATDVSPATRVGGHCRPLGPR